jgi:hypothetical protein
MGIQEIRAIKAGQHKAEREQKKRDNAKKGMPVESEKTKAAKAAAKKELDGEDPAKEKWFRARRREMTGTCQCGCARSSSKNDDENFRCSIAHILPKAGFPSVALHPLNWVERNFWNGCHANMDNMGVDRWPNFADWDDIKERFKELAPLLTDEERAKKFYQKLEKLVYAD